MLALAFAWHSPGAGPAGWFLLVCLVFSLVFFFFFKITNFSPISQDVAVGPFPRSRRAFLANALLPTKSAGFFLFR